MEKQSTLVVWMQEYLSHSNFQHQQYCRIVSNPSARDFCRSLLQTTTNPGIDDLFDQNGMLNQDGSAAGPSGSSAAVPIDPMRQWISGNCKQQSHWVLQHYHPE